MDTTLFLAQLWGPVILAVGAGLFVSRDYYTTLYRTLKRETLAVLVFAMAGIAIGAAQVSAHNEWGTLPQILVSFLGWGLLIKGAVLVVAPRIADRAGDLTADSKLMPFAGGLMLVVGAYLSWFGYLA